MSLILCIESGTEVCSVALSRGGELISLRESGQGRQHATNLGVYIDEIIRENDIDLCDMSAVAIGMGPGSYTGLRIGVSLAKGICYAAGIPLIGVNSLESMVHVALEDYKAGIIDLDCPEQMLLCPMIDARRMEVYLQQYNWSGVAQSEVMAQVIGEDSFRDQLVSNDLVIFGDGAAKCKEVLKDDRIHLIDVVSSARGLVKPAYTAFKEGRTEDVAYFEPFYLKDFVVTQSLKKIL